MRANPITPIQFVKTKAEREAIKAKGGLTFEQLIKLESVKEGTRQVVKELEEAKAKILALELKKTDENK